MVLCMTGGWLQQPTYLFNKHIKHLRALDAKIHMPFDLWHQSTYKRVILELFLFLLTFLCHPWEHLSLAIHDKLNRFDQSELSSAIVTYFSFCYVDISVKPPIDWLSFSQVFLSFQGYPRIFGRMQVPAKAE